MKVKELIEQLQKYDGDEDVILTNEDKLLEVNSATLLHPQELINFGLLDYTLLSDVKISNDGYSDLPENLKQKYKPTLYSKFCEKYFEVCGKRIKYIDVIDDSDCNYFDRKIVLITDLTPDEVKYERNNYQNKLQYYITESQKTVIHRKESEEIIRNEEYEQYLKLKQKFESK